MVIVVFGDEKAKIDDRHRLLESRVVRRELQLGVAQRLELRYEVALQLSEFRDNVLERTSVVVGGPRCPVFQIGRPKCAHTAQEILDPSRPEALEIAEMAGVVRNRPGASGSASHLLEREAGNPFFETQRRAAKTLDQIGLGVHRRSEYKLAVEPNPS
jgi:hypothetical protein